MDFQTKVELPAGLPPVSHAERILLMGSCFAENMGMLRQISCQHSRNARDYISPVSRKLLTSGGSLTKSSL